MRSDFDSLCKQARQDILIPEIPLAAIRQTHLQRSTRSATRRKSGLAGILAGLSIVAVAAAAQLWNGAHVVVPARTGVQLSTNTGSMVLRNPTGRDVDEAVRKLRFPVTLPAGLPAGTHFRAIVRFGTDALMLQYDLPGAWRRSNRLFMLILANPNSVNTVDHHRYKVNLKMHGW